MNSFASRLARLPQAILLTAAALIQVALIAFLVVDRAGILREGREVILQTRPIDPRDLLRGDYVALGYDISILKAGDLKGGPSAGEGSRVFVKLAPGADGFYQAVSVHAGLVPVGGPEVLIGGRVVQGATCGPDRRQFCDQLQIRYGLEKYFVPEGEGRALEGMRNQRRISVVAAVTRQGRAAIKRLLVDGQPVYEEPLL